MRTLTFARWPLQNPFMDFSLVGLKFALEKAPVSDNALLQKIIQNSMLPFYQSIYLPRFNFPSDPALVSSMQAQIDQELACLAQKMQEAEKSGGETDILDLLKDKANFYAKIGDRENAIQTYNAVIGRTSSSSTKIDMMFQIVTIAFVFEDWTLLEETLEKCRSIMLSGGDWDQRNKLNICEGMLALLKRDFAAAARLFSSSLATFSWSGLIQFRDMVKYCIVAALFTFGRKELKERVLNCPEVIEVLAEAKLFERLLGSFYYCRYADFFQALQLLAKEMANDYFLAPHCEYVVKEMKIAAFSQLLTSYKTISIKSVAEAFGVSDEVVDEEVAKFIVTGRLACTIDKVDNLIETKRTDNKNFLYQAVVKQGDLLLNRIQALSRVV